MKFPTFSYWCLLLFLSAGTAAPVVATEPPPGWQLRPSALVDAAGVHLDQLLATPPADLPRILLAVAPAAGQTLVLNRAQIGELLQQRAPEFATTNWSGPAQIKILRRTRMLDESEIKYLLTEALQRDFVKERGELEIRFTRPWTTVAIADEPFTVKVVDLPTAGVTPNCIVRFELLAGAEVLGNWQTPLQARIWREVWVAGSPLQRGQLLQSADVVKERRDVLTLPDATPDLDLNHPSIELAANLPAGAALTARSLRLRPIIRRGKVAEALVQDGSMTISVKVEVMEDGLPGQSVRVRNIKSKREFRGKVQSADTILVNL
jgi:flagella basal body P-ring formation protein FlgA